VFAGAPQRLQRQLIDALDLQLLYNKHDHQVTIHAVITDTTPRQLTALLTPPTGDPDPASLVEAASPGQPRPGQPEGFTPTTYHITKSS
jgi:hypothetical protein